ncbi:hypothetical protein LJC31_07640, partial [Synergistaceae bacterium OttesenSCG-928-I11]|nr:hypothetical protein [Synergistaceae bacterium OttesenSCG-928-I11]
MKNNKKTRIAMATLLGVVFSILLATGAMAYKTQLDERYRLMPWYGNPPKFINHFPLIWKKDIQGGYPHQRGEEAGMMGNPMYLTNKDTGALEGAYMVKFTNNRPDDNLWQGDMDIYDYHGGQLTKDTDLKAFFDHISNSKPEERNVRYWMGNNSPGSNTNATNETYNGVNYGGDLLVGNGQGQTFPELYPNKGSG